MMQKCCTSTLGSALYRLNSQSAPTRQFATALIFSRLGNTFGIGSRIPEVPSSPMRTVVTGSTYEFFNEKNRTKLTITVGEKIGKGSAKEIYKAVVTETKVSPRRVHSACEKEMSDMALEVISVSNRREQLSYLMYNAISRFLYGRDSTSDEPCESSVRKSDMLANKFDEQTEFLSRFDPHPTIHNESSPSFCNFEESEILKVVPLKSGSIEKHLKGDMNLKGLLTILRDASVGLSIVHNEDIVHSDVKPQNIFFDRSNEGFSGVLGDFDVCVEEGALIDGCTREYAAPEVLEASLFADFGGLTAQNEQDCYSMLLTLHILMRVFSTHLSGNHFKSQLFTSNQKQSVFDALNIVRELNGFAIRGITTTAPADRPSAQEIVKKLNNAIKAMDRTGAFNEPLGSCDLTSLFEKYHAELSPDLHDSDKPNISAN